MIIYINDEYISKCKRDFIIHTEQLVSVNEAPNFLYLHKFEEKVNVLSK